MRVLVTGAAGALGRLLCARLAADPAVQLFRADRAAGRDPDLLACDVTDAAAVRALLDATRPERIFHLAGSATGDWAVDRAVNADGAWHLLDAVRAGAHAPRVVLIGSAAEYGLVAPDENPVRETQPLRPMAVYGLTKAFQTQIAAHFAARHGADVVVARLFNLLAPGLPEHLIVGRAERLIARYRDGATSVLDFGNLGSTRDYVEGSEAVDQLLRIAARGKAGEAYHVASGRPVVLRDLIGRLVRDAGVPESAIREEPARPTRMGIDVPIIYADIAKTRALPDA